MCRWESQLREVKKLHKVTQLGCNRTTSQVEFQVLCLVLEPPYWLSDLKGPWWLLATPPPHRPQVSLQKAGATEEGWGLASTSWLFPQRLDCLSHSQVGQSKDPDLGAFAQTPLGGSRAQLRVEWPTLRVSLTNLFHS